MYLALICRRNCIRSATYEQWSRGCSRRWQRTHCNLHLRFVAYHKTRHPSCDRWLATGLSEMHQVHKRISSNMNRKNKSWLCAASFTWGDFFQVAPPGNKSDGPTRAESAQKRPTRLHRAEFRLCFFGRNKREYLRLWPSAVALVFFSKHCAVSSMALIKYLNWTYQPRGNPPIIHALFWRSSVRDKLQKTSGYFMYFIALILLQPNPSRASKHTITKLVEFEMTGGTSQST
jgi:hypothetical protein